MTERTRSRFVAKGVFSFAGKGGDCFPTVGRQSRWNSSRELTDVKNILNKLVIACILIPTGFWAVDLIRPVFSPGKIADALNEMGWGVSSSWRSLVRDGKATRLAEALSQYDALIAEGEEMIGEVEPLDPTMAREMRGKLAELRGQKEKVLAMREEELNGLDLRVLADLQRKEWQEMERSSERRTAIVRRMLPLQRNIARHESGRTETPAVGRVLNRWLDAVEQGDLDAAHRLMTPRSRRTFTRERMSLVRERLPQPDESIPIRKRQRGRVSFQLGETEGAPAVDVTVDRHEVAIDEVVY